MMCIDIQDQEVLLLHTLDLLICFLSVAVAVAVMAKPTLTREVVEVALEECWSKLLFSCRVELTL
jgi:hypothetical protein